MSPTNLQTNPVTEGDILALDVLFKRIAERGRKIRTKNKTVDSNNLGRETLPVGQVRVINEEQSKEKRDE